MADTDLWIPAQPVTSPALVWLPDLPTTTELPSEGAWGVIVVINH